MAVKLYIAILGISIVCVLVLEGASGETGLFSLAD